MSGWTALCLAVIGIHIGNPVVCMIAMIAYGFHESPSEDRKRLEDRIKKLEGCQPHPLPPKRTPPPPCDRDTSESGR